MQSAEVGEVAWRDALKHETENIGDHTAVEIQVELNEHGRFIMKATSKGSLMVCLPVGLLVGIISYSLKVPIHQDRIGMEFVKIAAGEFVMGCSTGDNDCTADEKPAHRVQITKVFEMMR